MAKAMSFGEWWQWQIYAPFCRKVSVDSGNQGPNKLVSFHGEEPRKKRQ